MRGGDQFMQDAALAGAMVFATTPTQGKQLLLQRAHAVQLRLGLRHILVTERLDRELAEEEGET